MVEWCQNPDTLIYSPHTQNLMIYLFVLVILMYLEVEKIRSSKVRSGLGGLRIWLGTKQFHVAYFGHF